MTSPDELPEPVTDVVQVHRRHLVQLMQRDTAVKADARADDVTVALIVDAELFRIDAAVRWLDSAEVRLRQGVPAVGARPQTRQHTARSGEPQQLRGPGGAVLVNTAIELRDVSKVYGHDTAAVHALRHADLARWTRSTASR